MNRSISLALLTVFVLQACEKSSDSGREVTPAAENPNDFKASPGPAVISSQASAATASAVSAQSIRYRCDNGVVVFAEYANSGADRVRLAINDKNYSLLLTPSASGARYQGSDGLTPGKYLIWWNKGSEAQLIEAPREGNQGAESSVNCQEVAPE